MQPSFFYFLIFPLISCVFVFLPVLTQLLETNTSDLVEEHRLRNVEANEYIVLESSSGDEEKKQTTVETKKSKPGQNSQQHFQRL